MTLGDFLGDSDSSSSSSSADSDSDCDDEGDLDAFKQFTNSMEQRMSDAGVRTPNNSNISSSSSNNSNNDNTEALITEEDYQFGATPGTSTHMYDLLLDALA